MKYWKGARSALLAAILVGALSLVTACTGPPVSSFTTDKTKVAVDESVQFTSKSTGEITSWSWDFGDGNTSTEQNPSHAYAEKGDYTVVLTVANKAGSHSATSAVTVLLPPSANFSASEVRATSGSTIKFNDESSGDIDSWSWDFGDGGSSTEQNPSHAYNDAGTYTVSLTVSNAASSDTREKKDYITITSFVVNRIEMCSDVTDEGDYTIQPDATFHVGDFAFVYFEVAGFDQQKTDGIYESWVKWQQVRLYDPNGKMLLDLSDVYEVHETYNTYYQFIWFRFPIGEAEPTDPLGEYKVEVKLEDKLSGVTAAESITFILE
jgi:PKD repeat protein